MMLPGTSPRFRRRLARRAFLLGFFLLANCANGDFGRIKPQLVTDDMHAWVGTDATGSIGIPASRYGLTDDERELRDLAYPLIEPPFDRQRWFSLLGEYGLNRRFGPRVDRTAYGRKLMAGSYRSIAGRYGQLQEDIRNDSVRIGPFFRVAARVSDLDNKRAQSMAYVPDLSDDERASALSRIAENSAAIAWVQHSVGERAESYRYALERFVVAYPSPLAVEAEQALNLLRGEIAQYQINLVVPAGRSRKRVVSK